MKNIVLILWIFLLSCDKEEQPSIKIPDGNYIGTFQRKPVWHESAVSNISLTFTSNKWSGAGNIQKYPALCSGTYSIMGDTILFENECFWTAEFDWSLILSGKYKIEQTDDGFVITRDYRSATTDTYVDRYIIKKTEEIQ